MVVVTATVYVCTSQAIFAVFGCTFALYPFVAMAVQLITLPGSVLPACWTVRQSTRDSVCLYHYNIGLNEAVPVPPLGAPTPLASRTILLLKKSSLMVLETFTVQCFLVEAVCPTELLVAILCISIDGT